MSTEVQTRKKVHRRATPVLRTPTRSKLKEEVRRLLHETEYTLTEVAEHCDVSYPFLVRLKGPHGEFENPGVDRVEQLYEFLSGKTLTF